MSWSVTQITLLERMAGTLSIPQLVTELAMAGDPHNERAVTQQATVQGISLRRRRRKLPWTEAEDRILVAQAGRLTAGEIAALLRETCFAARTVGSVKLRAHRLGLLLGVQPMGIEALERILPVNRATLRRWVAQGHLRAARRGQGRTGGRWGFAPADVRAFLVEHPDLYDWRHVKDGQWRHMARIASVTSPWASVAQAAAALRQTPRNVCYLARSGELEGAVKLGPCWRIPTAAIEQAAQQRRAS